MMTIRTSLLTAALIVLLLGIGCAGTIGRAAVKPPNHGKTPEQLKAHFAPPDMAGAVVDHRLRVVMPDDAATLSVWIIDPSNE